MKSNENVIIQYLLGLIYSTFEQMKESFMNMGNKVIPSNTINVRPIEIEEKISKIEKELKALQQKVSSLSHNS